jgi:aubergine-like protein
VEGSKLKVMKGYFTSIHIINGTPRVLIDVSTRVLRTENFCDTLTIEKNGFDQYIGRSVIADYGNHRIYTIEGIDTKMSPNSKFSLKGQDVTYKDFFKTHYGVEIKNLRQPMIRTSIKNKIPKKINDKTVMVEEKATIYLVPELVKLTGMEDDERNNFQLMKRMAEDTKMEPQ